MLNTLFSYNEYNIHLWQNSIQLQKIQHHYRTNQLRILDKYNMQLRQIPHPVKKIQYLAKKVQYNVKTNRISSID